LVYLAVGALLSSGLHRRSPQTIQDMERDFEVR